MISLPLGMTIYGVGEARPDLNWLTLGEEVAKLPVGTRFRSGDTVWVKYDGYWVNAKSEERATPNPVWVTGVIEFIPHDLDNVTLARACAKASIHISTRFLIDDLERRGKKGAADELRTLREAVERIV